MTYWVDFRYRNKKTDCPIGSDFACHDEKELAKLLKQLHEEVRIYGKQKSKRIVIYWHEE